MNIITSTSKHGTSHDEVKAGTGTGPPTDLPARGRPCRAIRPHPGPLHRTADCGTIEERRRTSQKRDATDRDVT